MVASCRENYSTRILERFSSPYDLDMLQRTVKRPITAGVLLSVHAFVALIDGHQRGCENMCVSHEEWAD